MVATPSNFSEGLIEKRNYLLKKFLTDYHYRMSLAVCQYAVFLYNFSSEMFHILHVLFMADRYFFTFSDRNYLPYIELMGFVVNVIYSIVAISHLSNKKKKL